MKVGRAVIALVLCVGSASAQEPPAPGPAPAPTTTPAEPTPAAPPPAPDPNPAPPPATPAAPAAPAATGGGAFEGIKYRHATTWDLNLEGGAGYVFGDIEKWTGFFRARPGILFVRNDDFFAIGATVEYVGLLARPAFGAQVEYLNVPMGMWAQLGGSIDTKGRPGFNGSIGLSLIGIEAQVHEFDRSPDAAFALLGKLRIPLGIIVYGLQTRK